jgi:ComF family protein
MLDLVSRMGRTVLDLVYPPHCVLCGRSGPFLCLKCEAALSRAEAPRCERCWHFGHIESARCPLWGTDLQRVRSAFVHEAGARDLVHTFKYDGVFALAEVMGGLLADFALDHGLTADVVTPVSLHPRRRRSRGYDQAEKLAGVVAAGTGIPMLVALKRTRATASQVHQPTAEERTRNVAGAFAVREPIHGLSVLLIDDVVTTGATLNAGARALYDAGAASVQALTFTIQQ